jgi:hypothetical protein
MPANYTGVPGNVGPNAVVPVVALPVDGDGDAAGSFTPALQALADQSALYLKVLQQVALSNWTLGTGAAGANDFASNGNSTYVAALNSITTTHWATSPDGKTWTGIVSAPTALASAVLWVPSLGLFVGTVVGSGTTTYGIETSPTGATWTARTVPDTNGANPATGSLAFGAGVLVATGNTGKVISSPDAITWTARGTTPMAGKGMVSVAFGGGQFVAISTDCYVFTSPDGLTWTARGQVVATAVTALGVVYNARAGRFVVVAGGGVGSSSSADGITWTAGTAPFGGSAFVARLAYAWGNVLTSASVSAGSGYNVTLYGSPDSGVTWNALGVAFYMSSLGTAQGLRLANDRLFVGQFAASPVVSLAAPGL